MDAKNGFFFSFITLMCLFIGFPSIAASQTSLVVMTHDSFNAGAEIIAKFENENNVKIKFLKAGDAGATLNQALLSKDAPMADVFFGVDNTFLSRAINGGIFEPYKSPLLESIPDELKLDPEFRLSPVDFGDVCLNYDKNWFAEHKLTPPSSLEDLIKPEFKGLTVVQNPATSSPGLAFLLATIGRFGENGFVDYWKKLRQNDVLVANGWEDAYYGHFTAASKGTRPVVVSYASSPPAEVHFSEKKLTEAPTAAVVSNGSAFRQIEFIGILKGTKNRKLAEKFIDFLLDTAFQEDIPLQMFVFPANKNARMPDVFSKYAKLADKPSVVDPEDISAKREQWIEAWMEAVLR